MSNTSKALLFIGLCVLGGSVTFAGFSAAENNKLKSDYTELNNQYEIIKKGYDDQQKLIISKDTTIEDLKRQLEELKSQQPTILTAGLYETGTDTPVKSWEQLIADEDITITDGALKCVNTGLAGDLICGKVEGLTSLASAFERCSSLTRIDISNLDTSNVTCMALMFNNCPYLTSIKFGSIYTSNVTDMSGMFFGCSNLSNIDLSSFDTKNVTNMSQMFNGCSSLTSIDLLNFNTNNVIDMQGMFNGCSSLTGIDLSSFDTCNVTIMSEMFSGCYYLTSLDLSNFDTSNVFAMDYMFYRSFELISINLGSFNISKVKNMQNMFNDSLTDITYAGTIEEWKAKNITNATTGIKEDGTVTVHCSDGDYVIGGSTETPTE